MDIIQIVNNLLDSKKHKDGVTSDLHLAIALQVSPATIDRWRKGQHLPKAVRALLPLAVEERNNQ